MIRRARKTLALMSGVALIAACSDRSVTSPAANPAGIDVAPDLHSTSGADIVVGVGASFQIQSVVAPFVGGVSNVSFRSANNAVATVSATGVVTGVGAGDTEIYETGGQWGHTYSVHVGTTDATPTTPPSGTADIVVGVATTFQIQSVVAPFVGGVSNVGFRSA